MTSAVRRTRHLQELNKTLETYNSRPEHWADILTKLVKALFLFLLAAGVCAVGFLSELHAHLHRIEFALKLRAFPDSPWDNRGLLKVMMILASFVAGTCSSYIILVVRHLSPRYLAVQKERVHQEIKQLTGQKRVAGSS